MSHETELESALLRAVGEITPALHKLQRPKTIALQFDRWKIELSITPLPGMSPERPEAKKPDAHKRLRIIRALGTATMKGEQIATAAGYSYCGSFRQCLSDMRDEGVLGGNRESGYFVERPQK